jgi:hypothetical protein
VSRPDLRPFDPDRTAWLEMAGWRAYYDRAWLPLLRTILQVSQEQFHVPFPVSLLAAYYATRAAAAWAPIDHDWEKALAYYERFYRLARRFSGLRFDPRRVAELEMRYNDVHRRLVGQDDKREFVETMVELHAALFGLPPERVRESAEWRVDAANAVDRITGHRSTDVEADWRHVEESLRRCYRSIYRELRGADAPLSPRPAPAGRS